MDSGIKKKVDIDKLSEELELLRHKYRIQSLLTAFIIDSQKKYSIEEIAWTITNSLISNLGFEDCVVYVLDESKECLVQIAAYGPKNQGDNEVKDRLEIDLGEGIVGTVAQTGIAECISDTSEDPRYIVDDAIRYSELAVPIIVDNKVIGVIDSEHSQKNFFNSFHMEILMSIAAFTSEKLMNAIMYKKLEEQNNSLELKVQEKTELLQQTVSKLKKSNQELEQYAHVVSHDLKQPLRSINSFIQLISRKEKNLTDSSKKYMAIISDSCKQMTKLLNSILDYASLNGQEKEYIDIDLNEILGIVLNNLSLQITESNCQMIFDVLPSLKAHELGMIQLFQNIISNSIKFKNPEIDPIIELTNLSNEKQVVIEIKDNGIGVEKDEQENIFSMFTKLHSKVDGTGLGLSLCKKIMEQHNGEIKFQSDGKGKGSTITLYFNLH